MKTFKEAWERFEYYFLLAVVILVFGIILFVILGLDSSSRKTDLPSLYGYYSGKNIIIYSYKLNNSQEYEYVAWHEWGHKVYNTELSRTDLKTWLNLSRECGISTAYAKRFKNRNYQLTEDFAESYAIMKTGGELCTKKTDFLKKWN